MEVFFVSFTYAVSDPGAVMVVGRNASLALSAMLCSKRLVVLALATVAKLDINATLCLVPLYCRLILSSVEL